MNDCLLVLDTLGTRNDAAILGITGLRFRLDDPTTLVQHFSVNITADSNRAEGRTFDSGGLRYWADRPEEAHEVFSREGVDLGSALDLLTAFYNGANSLWIGPGGMEHRQLTDAYTHFGGQTPWAHWELVNTGTTRDIAAWLSDIPLHPPERAETALASAMLRLDDLRIAYDLLNAIKLREETARKSA